jgi:hypothetical protein
LASPDTLCPICREKDRPPSHLKNHIYACSRCWGQKHPGRMKKWRQSAKGRVARRAVDARRVMRGGRRWWMPPGTDMARVRTTISTLMAALLTKQQAEKASFEESL